MWRVLPTPRSGPLARRLSQIAISEQAQPRYRFSFLYSVEALEGYRPGWFHPVHLGDRFSDGRYAVLHKLGFGGLSTVWLARDHFAGTSSDSELVSLKVATAYLSAGSIEEQPELSVLRELSKFAETSDHLGSRHILTYKHHFLHRGPNGVHPCFVSKFCGPTVKDMLAGGGRLKGPLGRKLALQAALAVDFLHSAGVVHGDITASNIIFRLSNEVRHWTDAEALDVLGSVKCEAVRHVDKSPVGEQAPKYVVEPFQARRLSDAGLVREEILLIDFGQAFFADRKPADYTPATQIYYLAPEAYFDKQVGFASDVWSLGCTLYEIVTGDCLFDVFFADADLTLKEVVSTLGKLPEPWWSSWEARPRWFLEDGQPVREVLPDDKGARTVPDQPSSLRDRLRLLSTQDPPRAEDAACGMFERAGVGMDEEEIELFADLLERMLHYDPERRIIMREVIEHPWFKYIDA